MIRTTEERFAESHGGPLFSFPAAGAMRFAEKFSESVKNPFTIFILSVRIEKTI